MREENTELYEEIVDKWSKIYKKKVGTLIDFEDLVQEAWVAILVAEPKYDSAKEKDENLRVGSYLATSVRNHLNDLLTEYITKKKFEVGGAKEYNTKAPYEYSPEKQAIARDLEIHLRERLKKIPHANFVFKYMELYSVKDISTMGIELGLPLSVPYVYKIRNKIRDEMTKLLDDEK